VSLLISIPVLYAVSLHPEFVEYYLEGRFSLLTYIFEISVYLLAWEFLFRGFLLFGLKEKLKELSILVQMIPFALLHFGKPEIETISSILGGIYLGYVVYRGNSYWPAFIIHLCINISLIVFINPI
jgi:membrane protease YdiL (CAAX protease family)